MREVELLGFLLVSSESVSRFSFVHLFVQLRQSVARHSLSFLGPQQPVEILDHVLAAKLCSLPVRDQNAAALYHLHKHIIIHNVFTP